MENQLAGEILGWLAEQAAAGVKVVSTATIVQEFLDGDGSNEGDIHDALSGIEHAARMIV